MKQKIIFCKGLPGSGKSTWAKQYCIDHPEFERINKDDIRGLFGNPEFSREFENKVLQYQRTKGLSILDEGKSLIVDDTNFAEKHWNFWSEMAYKRGIQIEKKIFDTPVEECISRDLAREKSVVKGVIMGMYNQFIKPYEKWTKQ